MICEFYPFLTLTGMVQGLLVDHKHVYLDSVLSTFGVRYQSV